MEETKAELSGLGQMIFDAGYKYAIEKVHEVLTDYKHKYPNPSFDEAIANVRGLRIKS